MTENSDNLVALEQSRLELEQNVSKLRASLRHWQQWEIEYESMKEELAALGEAYAPEDLMKIEEADDDNDFTLIPLADSQSSLLNVKEKKLLLHDGNGTLRSTQDVIGLLSRRIDYVQQNIRTVTSLLKNAEESLPSRPGRIQPEIGDEAELPFTEIYEELDEEGNVISSATSNSGQSTPQVVETLRKAGLAGLPQGAETEPPTGPPIVNLPSKSDPSSPDFSDASSESDKERRLGLKKRVAFAEGTKPEPDIDQCGHPSVMSDEEKEGMLRDLCNQILEEQSKYREAPAKSNAKVEEYSTASSKISPHVEIAERILRMHRNSEARRLLKIQQDGSHLSLRAAARLLIKMVETKDYHIQHYHFRNDKIDWRGVSTTSKDVGLYQSFTDEPIGDGGPHDRLKTLNRVKGEGKELLTKEEYYRRLPDTQTSHPGLSLGSKHETSQTVRSHVSEPGRARLESNTKLRADCHPEPQNGILVEQVEAATAEQDFDHHIQATQDSKPEDRNAKFHMNGDASSPSSLLQEQSGLSGKSSQLSEGISAATLPKHEPPEEAALRRQMLQYNLNEVGAVVAELNIEDDDDDDDGDADSDAYSSEEYSGVDLEESSDSEEDEDDYGRTSSRVLSEEYLAEMRNLEKKLKDGQIVNVGPDPKVLPATYGSTITEPGGDRRPVNCDSTEPKLSARKGVRFAEELDVHEAPQTTCVRDLRPSQSAMNPTRMPIIEREAPRTTNSAAKSLQKKPSQFKATRTEKTPYSSTTARHEVDGATASPATRKAPINAGTIVERPYDPTTKASGPDDLDPILVNQQVNAEYHRMRNNMIYREGGFSKRNEEKAEVPIDDGAETGRKKMSRFRAARLGIR
ncbi:MAG: hypothetical protein Q9163_002137 [Psora crenata]